MTPNDIKKRMTNLESDRADMNAVFQALADICFPQSMNFMGFASNRNAGAETLRRIEDKIYDNTAMHCIETFASALESMATPNKDKWHDLVLTDAGPDDDTGRKWLESLRDFAFAQRYAAKSGFMPSLQEVYRSVAAFGTGVLYVEDGYSRGADLPLKYRAIHLAEVYIAEDAGGIVDTAYRRFNLTARQAVQMFETVSDEIRQAADDKPDNEFEFIHAVMPSTECRDYPVDTPFVHLIIEAKNEITVEVRPQYEFPYVVFRLPRQPGQLYPAAPALLALPLIKSLNAAARDQLLALSTTVAPPMAGAFEGELDLSPYAFNQGAVDAQGNVLVRPLITGARPDIAQGMIDVMSGKIKDQFYINLFSILSDKPNITATEALIRDKEKSQLLGPVGAQIQSALAHMIDRELAIFERGGLFRDRFTPPPNLEGREWKVEFVGPLDRMRRAESAVAIIQVLESAGSIAQIDPTVIDNLDYDVAIRELGRAHGATVRIFRDKAQIDQMRERRAEEQEQAEAANMAQQSIATAAQLAPALDSLQGNEEALNGMAI